MFILDQHSITSNDVSNQHKATDHRVLVPNPILL
jgi:hypothetical protein